MKAILFILAILASAASFAQSHKAKEGLTVVEAITQNTFGICPGYYVVFKNGSKKTIDAIRWKVTFTNNFGEVLKTDTGQWQSGNIISPIKPGATTKEVEDAFVKGATQVWITITEVHFKK